MKHVFVILLATVSIISGCEKQQTNVEPAPRVVTIPDFAKGAVDAVGGQQAWRDTQVILGECAVKFYRPDGTFYLTTQRHAVYPWSDSIRIYAPEPQGTFVWQLAGSSFTLLQGTAEAASQLPITLCDPYIARAIWSVCAAPASVATQTDPDTAALGQATKVDGLWHYPVKLADGQSLYLSRDSDIFDIYKLEVPGKHIFMSARGYDYRTIKKTGIAIPGKIEIFTADSATAEPRRIIQFDYHTLESVGF